jgi:hypothetical protein
LRPAFELEAHTEKYRMSPIAVRILEIRLGDGQPVRGRTFFCRKPIRSFGPVRPENSKLRFLGPLVSASMSVVLIKLSTLNSLSSWTAALLPAGLPRVYEPAGIAAVEFFIFGRLAGFARLAGGACLSATKTSAPIVLGALSPVAAAGNDVMTPNTAKIVIGSPCFIFLKRTLDSREYGAP